MSSFVSLLSFLSQIHFHSPLSLSLSVPGQACRHCHCSSFARMSRRRTAEVRRTGCRVRLDLTATAAAAVTGSGAGVSAGRPASNAPAAEVLYRPWRPTPLVVRPAAGVLRRPAGLAAGGVRRTSRPDHSVTTDAPDAGTALWCTVDSYWSCLLEGFRAMDGTVCMLELQTEVVLSQASS